MRSRTIGYGGPLLVTTHQSHTPQRLKILQEELDVFKMNISMLAIVNDGELSSLPYS